jgi:hypothetical protein
MHNGTRWVAIVVWMGGRLLCVHGWDAQAPAAAAAAVEVVVVAAATMVGVISLCSAQHDDVIESWQAA